MRASIGEYFGYPIGSETKGKLAAALRALGFDRVYDTEFAADLTIMEEATEFIERVKTGGVLPMATSCCPACQPWKRAATWVWAPRPSVQQLPHAHDETFSGPLW